MSHILRGVFGSLDTLSYKTGLAFFMPLAAKPYTRESTACQLSVS